MTSRPVVPTLVLDGQSVASAYGANTLQLPAGPHRVELFVLVGRPFGQAGLDVEVPLGGVAEVFYAAPSTKFGAGSLGFTKQRAKGGAAAGIILGLVMGAMMLVVAVATWFNHLAHAYH